MNIESTWIFNQLTLLWFCNLKWFYNSCSFSRFFEQSSRLHLLVWYFQVKFSCSQYSTVNAQIVSISQFVWVFIYTVVTLQQAGQCIYSLPYFSLLLHQYCFKNLLVLLHAGILNYAESCYLISLSIIQYSHN